MAKYRVFVNSGHDTEIEPGACYHDLRECDITQSVGRLVTEELVKRGYEVTFVQDNSLTKIVDMANGVQANLFVSLHCNAVDNESVSGTEVWVHGKGSNATEAAAKISKDVAEALGIYNRGIKYNVDRPKGNNIYVLSATAMPAMLIEMFFISNKTDIDKFKNSLSGLITAICDGVDFYFN